MSRWLESLTDMLSHTDALVYVPVHSKVVSGTSSSVQAVKPLFGLTATSM